MAPASFKKNIWMIMTMVMICSSVVVVQAQEKKKKYSKKDLPAAVLSAFEKAYPKATIKGVDKEEEKGITYFEIESVDGKTKRDLLYTVEGIIYETEETIDIAALPNGIRNTLDKEYPKAKIIKAEKVTRDASREYELLIKIGTTTKEIAFDATGKILKGGKNDKGKEDDKEDDDDENE